VPPIKDSEQKFVEVREQFQRGEIGLEEAALLLEMTPREARKYLRARGNFGKELVRRYLRVKMFSQEHVMEILSIVISLLLTAVSLTVAFGTLYNSTRMHAESLTDKYISNSYSTFYALDKVAIDHPRVSHLFAGPSYYSAVNKDVKILASKLNPAQLAEARLEERQAASFIFDCFEETVLHYEDAVKRGSDRAVYLKKNLEYFTDNALQNPRLRWFWIKDGGGLSADYDPDTVRIYNERVLLEVGQPSLDIEGPFMEKSSKSLPKK